MSRIYSNTFATPLGAFSVAVDELGQVLATAFGDRAALQQRFHAPELHEDAHAVRSAREQVLAYFAGERREFSLPLAPQGTSFQHSVWSCLRKIPLGETRTYRQLAVEIERPKAARAVGQANALNPICLIVPCHRVIGADGSLTGFAFGEEIKRRLLEHERQLVAGRAA